MIARNRSAGGIGRAVEGRSKLRCGNRMVGRGDVRVFRVGLGRVESKTSFEPGWCP